MTGIWVFPLAGGLIGWLTNALAVRMIFRPRRRILGIQGLIPKRRHELAVSIGKTVAGHLVHKEDILKALPVEKLKDEFGQMVGERVDRFINERFIASNPMLGAFISDDMKVKIRQGVVDELSEMLPELEDKLVAGLESEMDLQKIVTEKIEGFDLDKLEKLILEIASRELKAIELIGGLIGAVVGLVQWYLVSRGIVQV